MSGYARHPGTPEEDADAAIRHAHFREMIEHHLAEHPPIVRVYTERKETSMYVGIGTLVVILLIILIILFLRRA